MFEERNQYADLAKRILSDRPLAVGYTASFSKSEQQVVQAVIAMVQERLGKTRKTVIDENEAMKYIEEHGGMERFARAYINDDYQHYEEKHQLDLQAIQQRMQDERQRGEEERQQQALMQMREKERADELLMIEAAKKLTKGLQVKAGQPADRASLALGAKVFEKLPDELLPEFMKYLKDNLGFELKGRDHGDILRDGREITEETVTREDLENGDIKLVISMDKLKSPEYARLLQEEQRTLDARETRVHEEAARDQRAQETVEVPTVEVNEGPEME